MIVCIERMLYTSSRVAPQEIFLLSQQKLGQEFFVRAFSSGECRNNEQLCCEFAKVKSAKGGNDERRKEDPLQNLSGRK